MQSYSVTSALRSTHYVSNYTQAADICSQPDLRFKSGFFMSPASFRGTHLPVPIFSQSRVEPFSDILAPSPWHYSGRTRYDEEKDHVWTDRQKAFYWRGSTTNGFSHNGGWRFHLRERFVHVAQRLMGKTDVGFTEIVRCSGVDCEEEAKAFPQLRRVDFGEFFKYRYMPDIDGSAFSGRWIAFLKSRGLPFKLAIFREWYDSRLIAWRHFVPLDVKLRTRDFRTVVEWFMSLKNEYWSKRIADAGREWALQTLRNEDAEIYLFRLLLEYGRVMNDERDRLGFTLKDDK
jgi:Glycosyl transferase family 90